MLQTIIQPTNRVVGIFLVHSMTENMNAMDIDKHVTEVPSKLDGGGCEEEEHTVCEVGC